MWNASQLLNSISAEKSAGDDYSFSHEFDAIKEARRFDDPSISQGEWQSDIKEADWKKVIQISTELLETSTKDLRVGMWLAEASANEYGFSGLAEGFILIAGLCERFWDNLYPLTEDGDQELRAGNLSWLILRSEQLVRNIPITEGTPYSYIDIVNAHKRAQLANKEDANKEQVQLLDHIESVRKKSSQAFYQNLNAQINTCSMAAAEMQLQIDLRLGLDGPSFAGLKQSLADVAHMLHQFVSNKVSQLPEATNMNIVKNKLTVTPPLVSSENQHSGIIVNREQALEQLRQVARFFRETEPHSPVAYLADKAAEWGNLPLHDWLKTVIKDNGSLSHVEELLGLSITPSSQES